MLAIGFVKREKKNWLDLNVAEACLIEESEKRKKCSVKDEGSEKNNKRRLDEKVVVEDLIKKSKKELLVSKI